MASHPQYVPEFVYILIEISVLIVVINCCTLLVLIKHVKLIKPQLFAIYKLKSLKQSLFSIFYNHECCCEIYDLPPPTNDGKNSLISQC